MLFKLDEACVRTLVTRYLSWVMTFQPSTTRDCGAKRITRLPKACRVEGRILISMDLDFSNIQMFPPANYAGLIVLRLRAKGRAAVRSVFQRVLTQMVQEPIVGRLWIVDEHRIRIHRIR